MFACTFCIKKDVCNVVHSSTDHIKLSHSLSKNARHSFQYVHTGRLNFDRVKPSMSVCVCVCVCVWALISMQVLCVCKVEKTFTREPAVNLFTFI